MDWVLIGFFVSMLADLVHGQDKSGFISIDCGMPESYTDKTTNINYSSDSQFIDTGTNHNISAEYITEDVDQRLVNLRSFPEGFKNCYTLRPQQGKDTNYLIRASFLYGNYDAKNKTPSFDLYIGVNVWDTVRFFNASIPLRKEIMYMATTEYIHICLVNTGSGIPFISAIEVRHLNNSIYKSKSGCMVPYERNDVDPLGKAGQLLGYNDELGRLWAPYNLTNSGETVRISTYFPMESNDYQLPLQIMNSAVRPLNATGPLKYYLDLGFPSSLYVYLHICELEKLQDNELREFDILLNDVLWVQSVVPNYLKTTTITKENPVGGGVSGELWMTIQMTNRSTLPPILNAMEIYVEKELLQSPTDQEDVDAIMNIASMYKVKRNWHGDPCVPKNFSWDGLDCSYNAAAKGPHPWVRPAISIQRIYDSLCRNLSSSGLIGDIAPYLSNLKSLQNLDLSNNDLSGPVPEFLSQLPALKILNLRGNNLAGSVPKGLIEKNNTKSLSLSLDGNPNLCWSDSCEGTKKKKNQFIVPLVASVVSSALILAVVAILWTVKRRRQQAHGSARSLESKSRQFTYAEIVRITNDFEKIVGKGGFGTVYLGYLENGTQVAVKMLSPSSDHGSEQFWTEVELLTRIHHRNLASLMGYCDRGPKTALVYEYMASGNLQEHLFDKNAVVLSWEQRLQIAIDTAQALEYLHYGCKPPIIHRDIKTANILLNEKLQAKVADFGLSRIIPSESETHVSTAVVGTFGYLDPEYYITSRLSEKSDVYSFGIVILELITGLPAVIKAEDNAHIVQWVMPKIERGELRNIVDPRLQGDFDNNSVWKAVETAISCVPSISIQRPTMSDVLGELKDCLDIYKGSERSLNMPDVYDTESSNAIGDLNLLDLESSMICPQAR